MNKRLRFEIGSKMKNLCVPLVLFNVLFYAPSFGQHEAPQDKENSRKIMDFTENVEKFLSTKDKGTLKQALLKTLVQKMPTMLNATFWYFNDMTRVRPHPRQETTTLDNTLAKKFQYLNQSAPNVDWTTVADSAEYQNATLNHVHKFFQWIRNILLFRKEHRWTIVIKTCNESKSEVYLEWISRHLSQCCLLKNILKATNNDTNEFLKFEQQIIYDSLMTAILSQTCCALEESTKSAEYVKEVQNKIVQHINLIIASLAEYDTVIADQFNLKPDPRDTENGGKIIEFMELFEKYLSSEKSRKSNHLMLQQLVQKTSAMLNATFWYINDMTRVRPHPRQATTVMDSRIEIRIDRVAESVPKVDWVNADPRYLNYNIEELFPWIKKVLISRLEHRWTTVLSICNGSTPNFYLNWITGHLSQCCFLKNILTSVNYNMNKFEKFKQKIIYDTFMAALMSQMCLGIQESTPGDFVSNELNKLVQYINRITDSFVFQLNDVKTMIKYSTPEKLNNTI